MTIHSKLPARVRTSRATPLDSGRRRWISLRGVLLGALCGLGSAALAQGFPVSDDLLIYEEDFQGESSLPTSPEVDLFGGGGLFAFTFNGGLPPVLTGTVARAEFPAAAAGDIASSLATQNVMPTLAVDTAIGLRGRYANLVSSDLDGTQVSLGADTVDTVLGTPSGFTVNVGLLFFQDGATLRARMDITETDQLIPAIPSTLSEVVPDSLAAAIDGGASFTLDLEVRPDASGGAAQASLEVDGLAPYTTAVLPLANLFPGSVFDEIGIGLVGRGSSLPGSQVDIERLALYRPLTSSFQVDTDLDLTDPTPGDGVCGSGPGTWALRAAIMESNALVGPGEVVVPNGSYVLTIAGADEDGCATGDLDITEELILRGESRAGTIVDGNDLDRVFEIPGLAFDTPATLRDLTIQGGYAGTATNATGGGIENNGQLVLERCVVQDNQANLAGGIMNRRSLEMNDCVVTSNEALALGFTSAKAGGIASASTSAGGTDPTALIRNSAIVDNDGPIVGGLEIGNAEFVRIQNSTFSGNQDRQISIFNGDVVLEHVSIVNGVGIGLAAGSFSGTNTLEIANSAIEGSPACSLNPTSPVVLTLSGNNASNDTSCGFSGPGDVEGTPLGLAPLAPVGESQAHVPTAGSPLVDAADLALCPTDDQVGTTRPIDGDASGSAECDLGAVEAVPEPGTITLLGSGVLVLGLAGARRRSFGRGGNRDEALRLSA